MNAYRKKITISVLLTELTALLLIGVLLEIKLPYTHLWLLAVFVLQAVAIFLLFKKINFQGQQTENSLEKLASGKLKAPLPVPKGLANKEITYVNQLLAQMKEATHFIETIASRRQEKALLHLGSDTHLGKALLDMSNKMKVYQEEENKRNWSAEGLANFSEVLRVHSDNIEEFSYEVVRFLVKYLKCNQGSFFIEQEDQEGEAFLELAACYAYDKRKYLEKKFRMGQSLVGQCAIEKEAIYLTDIPQGYVHITSGLGEATPANLVLLPLLVNNEVYGVIELASFQRLEDYQFAFLEKAAESTAATLGAVKVTMQTQQLLSNAVESGTDTRSRKDVLRYQLDSIIAMQQQMQESQAEIEHLFKAIDSNLVTATFDFYGNLVSANDKMLALSGYRLAELRVEGKALFLLANEEVLCWEKVQQGTVSSGDLKIIGREGEEKWINASFTPTQALEGKAQKVLMLGTEVTEKKLVLEKLSLVAHNTDNSVIITDHQGYIEFVNEGFTKLTGYGPEEVMGKKPGQLLQGPKTDQDTIKRIREKIKQGIPFYEEILNYRKDGKTYWISLMINPVKNEEGRIEKYISIQTNVSDIKETNLEYTYKLDAIGRTNAIIDFDVQGNMLDLNPIYLSVSGYEKEELVGKPYEFLLPESERGKPQVQMMWDNLKEGTFFSGEFLQKGKEGQHLWLNGTFNPIFDLEERLQKILMFAQFTTHEKEKQHELSGMLDAMNNSVMTLELDAGGALKKGNALFLQTSGYKRAEIARKKIGDIIKEADQIPEILARLQKESTVSSTLTLVTNEHVEKTYHASFHAIHNLEHHLHRVVIVLNEH